MLLPFLAPFFFTAARYGFSVSWKIATLMEVIVGTEGIGFMMRSEFQQFNMAGFLAWVLLFFAFALLLERGVLQRQMKRFYRWRPEVARVSVVALHAPRERTKRTATAVRAAPRASRASSPGSRS